MLTYSQLTGQLRRDGVLISLCYAGNGAGLNNPAMQWVKNTGPLPQGEYKLHKIDGEAAKEKGLGPLIFFLAPDPTNGMHGRSAFYIHWDNRKRDFSASEGCIVPVMPIAFERLSDGEDLIVTE